MLLDILLFPFTLAGWLIRGVLGLVGGLIGAVGGLLGLVFGLGMTVHSSQSSIDQDKPTHQLPNH